MILVSSFQLHHFCDSEMKAGKTDLCSVSLPSQRLAVPRVSLRKNPCQTFEEFSCICATISFFCSVLEKLPQQDCPGLLPALCAPAAGQEELAESTRLLSPGSAKTKTSHADSVLAKVTPGPAVVDLSLTSAEVSLSQ